MSQLLQNGINWPFLFWKSSGITFERKKNSVEQLTIKGIQVHIHSLKIVREIISKKYITNALYFAKYLF